MGTQVKSNLAAMFTQIAQQLADYNLPFLPSLREDLQK